MSNIEEALLREKREQVAAQCDAIARLATIIAEVRRDYVAIVMTGDMDGAIDFVGRQTARQMEALGDMLNGMDAVTDEDEEWSAPIFKAARQLWPDAK